MGIINTLDSQSANMIAAGEVVDRPASALKELIENSIDAGATQITAEIRGGGIAMLRVRDNGCGILKEDMPKTILRHATSKIKTAADLDGVLTLGFRGEALAALSSVAKTEIISKHASSDTGYRLYCSENGVELDECASAGGTVITATDLFYNQPARKKFLKKDASETAACVPVVEKAALAHPEISFTFITDGTERFNTSGDGDLYGVLYAVYGKSTADQMVQTSFKGEKVCVSGYISSPEYPRASRRGQVFFVNRRSVQSKTMQAALERGFESYIPRGKFPACVLNIVINPLAVDVNVHPAKLEVKFADERSIFEAVYCAVRNAFLGEVKQEEVFAPPAELTPPPAAYDIRTVAEKPMYRHEAITPFKKQEPEAQPVEFVPQTFDIPVEEPASAMLSVAEEEPTQPVLIENAVPDFTYAGEMWNTYIVLTTDTEVIIIDKHAAHERIIYEQLRNARRYSAQELLEGLPVTLQTSELAAAEQNREYFLQYGYSFDVFGRDTVILRTVPSPLFGTKQQTELFYQLCAAVCDGSAVPITQKCDKVVYTAACKAAIRAHDKTTPQENIALAEKLLSSPEIRYCPHGRPVLKYISKDKIDEFFDR